MTDESIPEGVVKLHTMVGCESCNGTGYYDNTGNTKCAFCNGTGVKTCIE